MNKCWSALLLLLFAFFFASTNLFPHVHEGPQGRIVHSHPWSGESHSHTDAQYQIIQLISSNIFEAGEEEHIDIPFLFIQATLSSKLPEIQIREIHHHNTYFCRNSGYARRVRERALLCPDQIGHQHFRPRYRCRKWRTSPLHHNIAEGNQHRHSNLLIRTFYNAQPA